MADEKELTCTVCLEQFSEPKVLPCCHTFCRGCLERILEKSKEKKKLTCPQCRSQHTLPETGPGGFLTDFAIAQKIKNTISSSICEQCETSDKAIAYCCDCETHLCELCSSAHGRMKVFRNHKVLPLESLSPDQERVGSGKPVSLYCSSHPTEPLKVYCRTCEALVCCECLVAKHQAHKLGSVDKETRNQVHTQLKSLATKVQQKLPGFEGDLEYIKEVEKSLLSRPGNMKSVINKTFDTLALALESRRKQLLSEAESKCGSGLKEVLSQKEQVETTVVALKSNLSFTERALQCSSDVELLGLSSQVLSRLRELSKARWDPGSIQQIERTSLKFEEGNYAACLQRIGKIEETPADPDDIIVQSLPATIPLGKETQFKLVGRFQKSRKCTPTPCLLKPDILHISVEYGGQSKKQMTLRAYANDDGTCTIPFTPICGGPHSLIVSIIGIELASLPQKQYEFKTSVEGRPAVGAQVCKGPDWSYGDRCSGVGTVISYYGYSIHVKWTNGATSVYNWGTCGYDIELAL